MKVAAYARVSTDIQREKETIKTQIEEIRRFCESESHTLIESYYDDGISGTIPFSERPAGKRLMEAARRHEFEAVVVYKSDRIGRDVHLNETVAKELYEALGIQVFGVAERIDLSTSEGRMMFTLQSVVGRMERENMLMRSRNATIRLAREGVWLGGIVPFGYRIDGKDREARLKVADEKIPSLEMSEADIVRMIYAMSADEKLSCIQISDRLNAMGVPTSYIRDNREVVTNKRKQKTRGVWRPARVRNMIVETTYKGVHIWGKRGAKGRIKGNQHETIERAVPALVDAAIWQRAQETLRKNRMLRPDVNKRRYLLRGLMKCEHCGLTYVGTANKGRSVTTMSATELLSAEIRDGRALKPYYYCNGKNKQNRIFGEELHRCNSIALKAHLIESIVWADLEKFLNNPGDIIQQLRETLEVKRVDTEGLQTAISKLTKDVNNKETERNNLYRLFRQERINDADLDSQLKEIEGEEKVLKAEIQRIQSEFLRAQNANDSLSSAETILLKLQSSLTDEISWETKRQIVEALVDSIQVETVGEGRDKVPKVKVKYRFEMPVSVPENAQVKAGMGARADSCLAGVKASVRAPEAEAATKPAPAPRRKFGAI